jgi:hypothetical protein
MPRLILWLLVGLLLAGFGFAGFVVLRERAASGRGMPAYSVYSEAGDGLGEAAHVLRRAGWKPVALTRPVQRTDYRGLLVLVQPQPAGPLGGGGFSEAEARGLLRWVGQGNTLLLCSSTNTPLHQLLGVHVTRGADDVAEAFTPVALAARNDYTEDIDRLSLGSEATLSGPRRATALWSVKGKPGALRIDRGRGRILVVADPGLLTRHGLVRFDGEPRDDNVMFLINVVRRHARDGRVLFAEDHHGFRAGVGFWSYLGHYGQRWTVLPVLLVVAVAAWHWAVRLGPPVPPPRPASADAVDYASALARLYQGAGARRLLARTVVRDFLDALTRHLRLRRTALPALILAAWPRQDAGPSADRLQALLRGVADLRKGDVPERQLLQWTRAFDEFVRDMQSATGKGERAAGGV